MAKMIMRPVSAGACRRDAANDDAGTSVTTLLRLHLFQKYTCCWSLSLALPPRHVRLLAFTYRCTSNGPISASEQTKMMHIFLVSGIVAHGVALHLHMPLSRPVRCPHILCPSSTRRDADVVTSHRIVFTFQSHLLVWIHFQRCGPAGESDVKSRTQDIH